MKVAGPPRKTSVMVSILIVTYHSAATIGECLLSLQKQTFTDFEVIIVDNNSTDSTKEVIDAARGSLSYLTTTFYLEQNLGFTGGNQYAFERARGSLIALLNPDTVAESNWLCELSEAMMSKTEVGICASQLIARDTGLIDAAGDGYSTSLKGFKRGEGCSREEFDEPCYVFGACAGASLYRRAMLEEIGFFDKDFFLIHEDTDLNMRAQLMGWKAFYVPTAVVYHAVSSSIGVMSDTAVYYALRNTELVRIKNVPVTLLLRYSFFLLFFTFLEFFYFGILHRKISLYAKAKMAALRMTPAMLKKRTSIQKLRKTPSRRLIPILTPVLDRQFFIAKVRKLFLG
jgi:GT2 family glycosyltransferase